MSEGQDQRQKDQIEKVLKFIKESGYPFEARIARAFANCRIDEDWLNVLVREYDTSQIPIKGALKPKMSVKSGVPYYDEREKKPRELDVHAVLSLKVLKTDLKINSQAHNLL